MKSRCRVAIRDRALSGRHYLGAFAPAVVSALLACGGERAPDASGTAGSGASLGGAGGHAGAQTAGGASGAAGAPAIPGSSAGSGGTGGMASPAGGAGGGSGSGGASGSGGTGAGGGAGAPPCGALFCEDFESFDDGASPQNARWTSAAALESFTVDSLKPAHGARALHVKYMADGEHRWIRTTDLSPALAAKHYGRIRVFMADVPPASTYRHWVTVAVGGTDTPNIVKAVGGETSGDHYVAQFDVVQKDRVSDDLNSTTTKEDRRHAEAVALVKDQWTCYEWFYDSDKNDYTLWLDGVEMKDAAWEGATDDPGKAFDFPQLSQVFLSWWEYHPQNVPWEVFIDDFALNDTRIGCD